MIDWTDKAIEAAIDTFYEGSDMRAALDAALAVQGCLKLPDCKTYADRAYADGRAEALEEAAASFDIGSVPVACCDVARELRKRKETKNAS